MQMIIVDDEAHWVDNLSMTKPWHTLGIEHVHKAYSAREALQIKKHFRTRPWITCLNRRLMMNCSEQSKMRSIN